MEYRATHRELQARHDTVRLADRLAETAGDVLVPYADFIHRQDMFILATADADGQPQCSYKGGAPGFVRVVDDSTVAFPLYDGNGMFLSAGNVLENTAVGLLFIDFASGGSRLRLNGDASIDPDDPLVDTFPGALMVVRVRARAVFPNCKRYVHAPGERSVFVPDGSTPPPVPDWKRHEWFDGTLPADDPAHDPDHPTAASIPEF